jgi:uncharacterized membrane protein YeaQ/YmgE (transglycosylase-associated protein family)
MCGSRDRSVAWRRSRALSQSPMLACSLPVGDRPQTELRSPALVLERFERQQLQVLRLETPWSKRGDALRDFTISGGLTMGILAWIIFGGLAGLVAGFLTGGGGGIIYNIIVGIVGALLGGFIMNAFGSAGVTGWNWRSFGVAVLGAVVLLIILGFVRGRGRVRGRRF